MATRYEELYSVSERLYDLVNASARVNDVFKATQVAVGDVEKGEDVIELGNRPMFR